MLAPWHFCRGVFGFVENGEDFGTFWLVPALNTDRTGPFCANICRIMVVSNAPDSLVQLAICPCLPPLAVTCEPQIMGNKQLKSQYDVSSMQWNAIYRGITMQAATAATIEYTDYPECERRIYPTENDIAFYKTYEFCEAEGALQVYSKLEGVGHKLSAIRQFAPNCRNCIASSRRPVKSRIGSHTITAPRTCTSRITRRTGPNPCVRAVFVQIPASLS